MSIVQSMQHVTELLVQKGKGILAVDESHSTIAKRFKSIGVESTKENRRAYRSMILSTPSLRGFISGVILFEETLNQCTDSGVPIPELLSQQGIIPGIKVDQGRIPLANADGDEITQGLDDLAERLNEYYSLGARFAKWRNVYHISTSTPSQLAIEANAEVLARYAAICQQQGFVPIVEAEVLMDGDHTIYLCAEVTELVLHAVFHALHRHRVVLENTILKPNMVLPGNSQKNIASPEDVAAQTIRILRRTVPAAIPSINFLSGGLTPQQATMYLNAINSNGSQPWELSFSFGRALQQPALALWLGNPNNKTDVQTALLKRALLNAAARYGEYNMTMETSDTDVVVGAV